MNGLVAPLHKCVINYSDDRMQFAHKWLAILMGAATMFVWGGISHMVLVKRHSREEIYSP